MKWFPIKTLQPFLRLSSFIGYIKMYPSKSTSIRLSIWNETFYYSTGNALTISFRCCGVKGEAPQRCG